ncbi:hypothetical protein C8J56DRAFT_1033127 [Mycena floridula]|nr:hypothetical protein C8J56DRAFT_1033127 [Mycena floridula]
MFLSFKVLSWFRVLYHPGSFHTSPCIVYGWHDEMISALHDSLVGLLPLHLLYRVHRDNASLSLMYHYCYLSCIKSCSFEIALAFSSSLDHCFSDFFLLPSTFVGAGITINLPVACSFFLFQLFELAFCHCLWSLMCSFSFNVGSQSYVQLCYKCIQPL